MSPSGRTATWLRPASLASYIVMSASARMSVACSLAAWKVTAPTLAVTRRRTPSRVAACSRTALHDGPADPLGAGLVAVGQQHGELVATEPGDDVGVAHGPAQDAADRDEELVAGVVAEAVVDLLEVVEVEQQDRAALAVATAALEVPLELGVEPAPVGQAGQHVVVDEVGEAVLVATALGHVDDVDQHDVGLVGSGATQQAAAQRHVDVLAAVVAQHAVGGAGARARPRGRGPGGWRSRRRPEGARSVSHVPSSSSGGRPTSPHSAALTNWIRPVVSSTATPCGASRKSRSLCSVAVRAARVSRSRRMTIRCTTRPSTTVMTTRMKARRQSSTG